MPSEDLAQAQKDYSNSKRGIHKFQVKAKQQLQSNRWFLELISLVTIISDARRQIYFEFVLISAE